jgi:tetratricopeptide (TPR) repeat protein
VYHSTICVPRLVLENSRQAVEEIDSATEPALDERREALAGWAWAEAVAGSVEEADRLLAELGSGQQGELLETYDIPHAQALAHMRRGDFTAAYAPSEAAGQAAEAAGRPDLAYGCWANAAGAAAAADDYEQALAFLDRALVVEDKGLQSIEVHVHAARSWVLIRLGRLDAARAATEKERAIADLLGQPELVAMAAHDRGLLAFEAGDYEQSEALLAQALEDPTRLSRALTRLTRAEALVRCGKLEEAATELRATVLEPVRPSDFPDALVPRLARVQGLLARARGNQEEAERRLRESVTGWEQRVARTRSNESMTAVMADLGRPVVGIVEPERELGRARADLEALIKSGEHAVVS